MLHILQYTSDKCYLGLSLLRCYCENRPDDLLFSVTLPSVVHNTSQYLLPSQYTLGVFCWEDIIISSIRYYCIILGIFCNFNILFVMTMIKIHSSRFYNQPSADEHNFFRFQPYGVYKTSPYVVLKLDDTRDLSNDFKNTFAFCPPVNREWFKIDCRFFFRVHFANKANFIECDFHARGFKTIHILVITFNSIHPKHSLMAHGARTGFRYRASQIFIIFSILR